MPRFVLLRHECPADYRDGPHWDLMLERAGTEDERRLATWSLLELPRAWGERLRLEPTGGETVLADPLPDHRAAYLEYEGPVSGDRGRVTAVARGELEWLEASAERYAARLLPPSPLAGELVLAREAHQGWKLSTTTPNA